MEPRILVVDDEAGVHRMVRHHLRGHRLVHAHNGWEAAWALVQNEVDLVLLDVNLPGRSGLDILGEIRQAVRVPIVVMFTSDASATTREEAARRGADGFIAKTYEGFRALETQIVGLVSERGSGPRDSSHEQD